MHFSSTTLRRTAAILAIALGAALTAPAQQTKTEKPYTLSDKTSEELGKLQPLMGGENPNWDAALPIINGLIAKVDPNSYDMAVAQQIKAQILLRKSEYAKAIEPLERCVILSDSHTPPFFDPKVVKELVYYLSQLYYQEAVTTKDAEQSRTYFDKAETYITRWVKMTEKPTADGLTFYASLLYNRAAQNPDHIDARRVELALQQVETALRLTAHPKDNLYILRLACLQSLNRNQEATETLELLVKHKPDNKQYWNQLAALYLNAGQDIRAIVTIERAQAQGIMNSPKDNFNLVGIYFNIGQYEKAAELLEKGLKDGSIENEQKNWELLSYSYQQLRREFKAIDALERAAKQFPQAGQLEYLIAQSYYSLEKPEDALKHLELGVKKGNLTKPYQAYLFLAYVAFELKKFDVALDAANKAITFPEGVKEGERMKNAVTDAMKDRETKLNAM